MTEQELIESRRRAIQKHDREKSDRITVRLQKGTADVIRESGHSINSYVKEAVKEKMERDGLKNP